MRELVIDSFAGGGGASLGISLALGRAPDVAINHDPGAIEMHAANHPATKHYTRDVWKLQPRKVTRGRPVGLLWASPDCCHFSRAKGGKPVKKHIRGLAWMVVKWAEEVGPRVIILENVREFQEWGPLVPRWQCRGCDWRGTEGQAVLVRRRRKCPRCDGTALRETDELVPDPSRKGLTFKRWAGRLRNLGYKVEWKVLNAADYGAPTHRRRLFLIARNDSLPIVWPEPTHGDPRRIGSGLFDRHLRPWRTAAECIDWSIPCPSIFLNREQGRKCGVNRPLAEKTLQRIARGVKRYVLDNPRPFLVVCNHGGPEFRGQDLGEPLPTLTASRDARGLVVPYLVGCGGPAHGGEPRGADAAMGTVMPKNSEAVVAPFLARLGQGNGNGKYVNEAGEPLTTVVSKAEHMLVAPCLVPRYGEAKGQQPRAADVQEPLSTIVPTGNGAGLVAAFFAKHYGGATGCKADSPLPTTTARGTQTQLVAANLIHMNHGEKQWSGADEPLRTVTSGNHAALVYSFLVKYFGTAIGHALDGPMHTATGKDRFGLVTVTIDGEPYVIVDIGMRMLKPRELARGQGFPDSYVLTGTATNQTARIGNSVPPVMARKLVEANYEPVEAGCLQA